MLKKWLITLLVPVALGVPQASAEPRYPASFNQAKEIGWRIYADKRVDQYCGCTFDNKGRIDLGSCDYAIRKDTKRAKRIEWEHVVAAEHIGRQLTCWKEGGRDHCSRTDQAFKNAHNDLVNLIPVVGEVNGNRSNFRFAELPQPYGQYGSCPFKVDFSGRKAEPPPAMKGDIARIAFYMQDVHGVRLSDQQTKLFKTWSKKDPVDAWELERDKRILRYQGSSNHYVSGKAPAARGQLAQNELRREVVQKRERVEDGFSCSVRKSCSAMSSCDEAMFHLLSCGNTRLDGNQDGTPCEAICRK